VFYLKNNVAFFKRGFYAGFSHSAFPTPGPVVQTCRSTRRGRRNCSSAWRPPTFSTTPSSATCPGLFRSQRMTEQWIRGVVTHGLPAGGGGGYLSHANPTHSSPLPAVPLPHPSRTSMRRDKGNAPSCPSLEKKKHVTHNNTDVMV